MEYNICWIFMSSVTVSQSVKIEGNEKVSYFHMERHLPDYDLNCYKKMHGSIKYSARIAVQNFHFFHDQVIDKASQGKYSCDRQHRITT